MSREPSGCCDPRMRLFGRSGSHRVFHDGGREEKDRLWILLYYISEYRERGRVFAPKSQGTPLQQPENARYNERLHRNIEISENSEKGVRKQSQRAASAKSRSRARRRVNLRRVKIRAFGGPSRVWLQLPQGAATLVLLIICSPQVRSCLVSFSTAKRLSGLIFSGNNHHE